MKKLNKPATANQLWTPGCPGEARLAFAGILVWFPAQRKSPRRQPDASIDTMHFGPPIPSNIYAVGLSRVLAKAKVYAVKH